MKHPVKCVDHAGARAATEAAAYTPKVLPERWPPHLGAQRGATLAHTRWQHCSTHVILCTLRKQTSYLWVKENFRAWETFLANIDNEFLLAYGIVPCLLFDPLPLIHVILGKLLDYIGANVTVLLLQTHTQRCHQALAATQSALRQTPSNSSTTNPRHQSCPMPQLQGTLTGLSDV